MVGWLHLLTSAGGLSEEMRGRALAGLQRAVEQQRRVVSMLDSPADYSDGHHSDDAGAPAEPPTRRTADPQPARVAPAGAAASAPVSAPVAVTTSGSSPSPSTLLEGVYVLAVDDDPDVLQMLQSLLEHSGAIVESTTSPNEALRRYPSWARGSGDRIVLSDLAMQERDGISLLQAMREIERARRLRRLPAIALSAHFRPDTRREAFDGGFDLFLAKPIDPFVLLNHLRNMLDR